MKILHVVAHARPSGVSRELSLLLTDSSETRVCCLGVEGPASAAWREQGVVVDVLGWRRWFDLLALRTLGDLLRQFQPDLVHAWGTTALSAVRLAAPKLAASVAVRRPLPSKRRFGPRVLSFWDRWLLRGADHILARHQGEAAQCMAAGLPAAAVRVVPPGVQPRPVQTTDDKPYILCAGRLLPHKGFQEAIWAFDILHFVNDEVELVIAGDGPQRRRLGDFAASTGLAHRIHFLGEVPDLAPWLEKATVVWVPSLTNTGATLTLEAMAAGRPVVASQCPILAELVIHGETGFLIKPGNKMELARQTRHLLNDKLLRRRLGEAGRRRTLEHHSPQSFVAAWTQACQVG